MVTLSESQLRQIIESLPDGLLVVDHSGRVQFANAHAEQILGVCVGELVGENFGSPGGSDEGIELVIVRDGPQGMYRSNVEVRTAPMEWEGKPAFMETVRDVTQSRSKEHEAREEVLQRDQFLAVLSHELRNPLAALNGAVRLIDEAGGDVDRLRRACDVIARQSLHMQRLLDDLLDVARTSVGRITLQNERLRLDQLIRDAIDLVRPDAEAEQLTIYSTLPDAPLTVMGDPIRLQQILGNLLTNAIKYNVPGGAVQVVAGRTANASATREQPGWPHAGSLDSQGRSTGNPGLDAVGEWAFVQIRDSGIGIPPEMLNKIFEPFVQVHTALERSKGGLGLGLALVHRLVELHGGHITVTSAGPQRGSEFTVYFPMVEEVPSPEEPPHVVLGREHLRLVLVEDQDDVCSMLVELLTLGGHDVDACSNGRDGVEMIRRLRPDLALVDIGLPGLNGYRVARAIREMPELDEVVLIALTGYGQPSAIQQAKEAGFQECLIKPIHFDQLERLLAQFPGQLPSENPNGSLDITSTKPTAQ